MNIRSLTLILIAFPLSLFARNETSRFLPPVFDEQYYTSQALKYFDTLDSYAPRESKPIYAKKVIRWEWYPWLKLTGYKSWMMGLDYFLTWYPTKVINRDCRHFKTQPFARCHVTFIYKGHSAPVNIYEEFTFNNLGEITFIEAWTDSEKYFPSNLTTDYWAESESTNRLSTVVPGLGNEAGLLSPKSSSFKQEAQKNENLYDLLIRLKHPLYYWTKELARFSVKRD